MATHSCSCLENPHCQRSLAAVSGVAESDTAELLSTAQHIVSKMEVCIFWPPSSNSPTFESGHKLVSLSMSSFKIILVSTHV